MDYETEVQWRYGVRQARGMQETAFEFMRHAGMHDLVEYGPNPLDPRSVRTLNRHPVRRRFDLVATRWSQTIERYYHDLSFPSANVHPENLKNALRISGAVLRASLSWMEVCTAMPSQIEAIFKNVRDAVSEVAKCSHRLSEVAIDGISETILRELYKSLQIAGCRDLRLTA
ncbi:MAG: hypothetical protein EON59_09580 [Alphaproteobacteria bacterium]|nr:MAG: hypothetical protein EON59_09580 [Alphaproteobacteria bacterium]